MRKRLTDRLLKGLKPKAERYHVGDSVVRGLRVRVSPDGTKVFSCVYRAPNGAVRTFTIGAYEELSLKKARDAAKDVKAGARLGSDAQAEKVRARKVARSATDFAGLATQFVEDRKQLADSTRTEYTRMVTRYIAGSTLGDTAVGDVKRRDLRAFLEAIASDAPVMANRVYQLVRAACRWAVREELLESDPSAGLERPRKESSRDRVLTDGEVAILWRSLDEHVIDEVTVKAARPEVAAVVRALLLLGQRSTETVEMRWADLDLDGSMPAWTIPGEFRKGGRLHVVPLAPSVVAMLKALPAGEVRVFGSIREANAERDWWGDVRERAEALYREMRDDDSELPRFAKHDLRRTCATGCAKLGAAPWIVSRILGHATTQGTVAITATYNRYSGLPEMASALNAWAVHVERVASGVEIRADVVPMRGRA